MIRLRLRSRFQSLGIRFTPRDRMPGRYLFLHIMKTGGTSLRRMLIARLGADAVYPNDADLARLPNGWYPLAGPLLEVLPSVRPHTILVGHLPYSLCERLPGRYEVITFLRDPVERSLSHMGEVIKAGPLAGSDPLDLIHDESFMRGHIANHQAKVLGMPFGDIYDPGVEVDAAMCGRAVENLRQCAFVGITERFEDSCRLFDQRFGTRLSRRIRRDNIGRKKPNVHRDELVKALLPHLEWDLRLYREAVALFNRAVD